MVGVASSPTHATHEAILRVRSFSLCWLDASLLRSVEMLGTTPNIAGDKLQSAGLKYTKGKMLDVPIIDGSVAALECSLYLRQNLGDHELLIGKVQGAWAVEDFQEYWRFQGYTPLLYAGIQNGSFKTYQPRAGA